MRRSLLLVNPQFPQGDKASGMKRTCWKELWVHDRSQEGCSIIPYMRGVWYLWSMISQSSNKSIAHELIGIAIDIKSKNPWMLTWKVKAVILTVCTYIHTEFVRPWSRDRFYMRAQPPDWIQICVEPDQQAVRVLRLVASLSKEQDKPCILPHNPCNDMIQVELRMYL